MVCVCILDYSSFRVDTKLWNGDFNDDHGCFGGYLGNRISTDNNSGKIIVLM